MQKKLVCVLIILIFVVLMAVPVLAHPLDDYMDNIPMEGVVGEAAYIEHNEDGPVEKDVTQEVEKDIKDTVKEIDPLEELLQKIIKSKDIVETKRFLVTFTQPLGNCMAYDNQSFICGFKSPTNKENTDNDNNLQGDNQGDNMEDEDAGSAENEEIIIVILARYNEETDTYEEYKNAEGESRWSLGSFGLFTKAVDLLKGINKLKIIVFRIPVSLLKTNINPEAIDANSEAISEAINVNNVNTEIRVNQPDLLTENILQNQYGVEGENKTKTNAYDNAEAEDIILESGKNLQITYFTINVLNEATKDELINKPAKISNMFINMFPNVFKPDN